MTSHFRRVMQFLNRRSRRQRRPPQTKAESLLQSSLSDFSDLQGADDFDDFRNEARKTVRSTPSKRHLNADGTSGPQLHSLLEKVVASHSDKRLATRIKAGTKKKLKFIIRGKTKKSNTGDPHIEKKSCARIKASKKDSAIQYPIFEHSANVAGDGSGSNTSDDNSSSVANGESPDAAAIASSQNMVSPNKSLHTRALHSTVPISTSEVRSSSFTKPLHVTRKIKLKEGHVISPHPINSNKVDSRLTHQTDESSGILGKLLDNPSTTVSTVAGSTKGGNSSRTTHHTDESSGRRLQSILQKLVCREDSMPSSIEESEGYGFSNSLLDGATPQRKELSQKTPSPTSVAFDFQPSKTRFEMNDRNEEARKYIMDRKKQTKMPRRNLSVNGRVMSNLEVTRLTTVGSISSCSFDSVLDDPERLEKYRLLNQAPPAPPPNPPKPSRHKSRYPYPLQVNKDFFENGCETFGAVTRFFGCTS